MTSSIDFKYWPRNACVVWVNLTGETQSVLSANAADDFDVYGVCESSQISAAIDERAPLFACFEFDEPDSVGMAVLMQIRGAHPNLHIVMIIGGHSHSIALWAPRSRVWELLVKPVSYGELRQHFKSLVELTQRRRQRSSHNILFASQFNAVIPVRSRAPRRARTQPAIEHVMTNFASDITLADVASLCRLSPSRFCHVFREEQGMSFGQHLLQYRLARASEQLADPAVLAKKVAYSVGFNDLSYFARAFKRQLGVSPSRYRATARLS